MTGTRRIPGQARSITLIVPPAPRSVLLSGKASLPRPVLLPNLNERAPNQGAYVRGLTGTIGLNACLNT